MNMKKIETVSANHALLLQGEEQREERAPSPPSPPERRESGNSIIRTGGWRKYDVRIHRKQTPERNHEPASNDPEAADGRKIVVSDNADAHDWRSEK